MLCSSLGLTLGLPRPRHSPLSSFPRDTAETHASGLTAQLLACAQADVLATDKRGATPLHAAVEASAFNSVEALLSSPSGLAAVGQLDAEGRRPIDCVSVAKKSASAGERDDLAAAARGALRSMRSVCRS